MNADVVLELFKQTLTNALILAGPILILTLIVGVIISIFQTVTSVQEMTLSFVPKVAVITVTLVVAGHWMLQRITFFTMEMFQRLPEFAR
jgi:flagellar biosynthesis protein FliQ